MSHPQPGQTSTWLRERPPRWLPRAVLWTVTITFGLYALWWGAVRLHDLLVILLCGLFVGFAIEPGVNWLARHSWPRGLATLVIYLLLILAFVGLVAAIGTLVVDQVVALARSLPGVVTSFTEFLDQRLNIDLQAQINKLLANLGSVSTTIASNALSIGATIVGSIFNLFTVGLFAFYFATEGPKFRRAVCSVLPPARQRLVLEVWETAITKTAGYLYSRALLALASAVATGLFLALLKIPNAMTLGIFVGIISQFIPTIGTYIAGALPVLVALSVSPGKALAVLVFVIAYQQFENYFLTPPLSARTMELHPAVAFASVIAGAALLGAPGALLALPVAATVQATISSYVQRHDLIESEMLVTPVSARRAAREAAETEPLPRSLDELGGPET